MSLLLEDPPKLSAPAEDEWSAIVASLTRRQLIERGIGLGAAVLLGDGVLASVADAADSGWRTIETAKGKVKVPAAPKRIVSIQPAPLSTLYDLGLPVWGVYDLGAQYVAPRYRTRWKKAAKVGTAGQISVEKVAALHPDLIIGADYSWNSDVYSQLSKVAPTVLTVTNSWIATAQMTANAVNRTHALQALKERLAERSRQIKTRYAATLRTYRWDLLQGGFTAGEYWIYGPSSDIGRIYAGAGVRFASATRGTHGFNRTVSYEQIDLLSDADVIGFYANYDGTPNNESPKLFAQAGFKRLAAVKAKHLVPIPDFLPGGYGDALAALDELEAGLEKLKRAA